MLWFDFVRLFISFLCDKMERSWIGSSIHDHDSRRVCVKTRHGIKIIRHGYASLPTERFDNPSNCSFLNRLKFSYNGCILSGSGIKSSHQKKPKQNIDFFHWTMPDLPGTYELFMSGKWDMDSSDSSNILLGNIEVGKIESGKALTRNDSDTWAKSRSTSVLRKKRVI